MKTKKEAPAGMAQLVGMLSHRPEGCGLVPSQGLGAGLVPGQGACGRQLINVLLSHQCFFLSLTPFLSLSESNGKNVLG